MAVNQRLPAYHENIRTGSGVGVSLSAYFKTQRNLIDGSLTAANQTLVKEIFEQCIRDVQNAGGGTIHISEGTYELPSSETVTIPSGVHVVMADGIIGGSGTLTFASGSSAQLPESRQCFDVSGGLTVTFVDSVALSFSNFGATSSGAAATNRTYCQAALDSMMAGGTIQTHALYPVSGPLFVMFDQTTVCGNKDTGFQFDQSADWFTALPSQRPGIITIQADHCRVRGLKIDCNYRSRADQDPDNDTPYIAGIAIGRFGVVSTTTDTKVEDVWVYDHFGDGILNSSTSANKVEVSGCLVQSTLDVQGLATALGGYQSIGISNGTGIHIHHNQIYGAMDDACVTHNEAYDVIHDSNIITTTGGRLHFWGKVERGNITNNTIRVIGGNPARVIDIQQPSALGACRDILVANNNIVVDTGVTIGYGIYLLGPGDNITVRDNKVYTVDQQSQLIGLDDNLIGGVNYGGNNISITGNHLINGASGILLAASDPASYTNVDISGNTIQGCTTALNSSAITDLPVFGRNTIRDCGSASLVPQQYFTPDALDKLSFTSAAYIGSSEENMIIDGLTWFEMPRRFWPLNSFAWTNMPPETGNVLFKFYVDDMTAPSSVYVGTSKTFADGDVSVANDTITYAAHTLVTGDMVRFANSGGSLPAGLTSTTNYWAIVVDADTFKVATTRANALGGTNVNVTGAAGGGTHTFYHEVFDIGGWSPRAYIEPGDVITATLKGGTVTTALNARLQLIGLWTE